MIKQRQRPQFNSTRGLLTKRIEQGTVAECVPQHQSLVDLSTDYFTPPGQWTLAVFRKKIEEAFVYQCYEPTPITAVFFLAISLTHTHTHTPLHGLCRHSNCVSRTHGSNQALEGISFTWRLIECTGVSETVIKPSHRNWHTSWSHTRAHTHTKAALFTTQSFLFSLHHFQGQITNK